MEDEVRTAVPSAPRLAPEDIATRSFSNSFRGLSESEVRSFLKRIAEEMTSAQIRERELRESLTASEVRANHREPLDESQLLEALGEETAKLLRSAREAANDIRTKAEVNGTRTRAEATEAAAAVREEAANLLDTRRAEADREIAELRARIDAELTAQRAEAEAATVLLQTNAAANSERVLEQAKVTGRSMVEEAKALRDRVLADLGHRRGLLQSQITELKTGREQLLDAYRIVKRTFLEATEALGQAESRASQSRPPSVGDVEIAAAYDAAIVDDAAVELGAHLHAEDVLDPDVVAAPDAEISDADATELALTSSALDSVIGELPTGGDLPQGVATSSVEGAGEEGSEAVDSPSASEIPEVEDLFARIRAQSAARDSGTAVAEPAPPEVAPASDALVSETVVSGSHSGVVADVAGSAANTTTGDEAGAAPAEVEEINSAIAVVLTPTVRETVSALVSSVIKKAKRTSQDEQNELLDAIRRQKRRAVAAEVLPQSEEQTGIWAVALASSVGAAFSASSADESLMPESLGREVARDLIAGLRARLVDAIDNGDIEGMSDRVNARFREWKTQDLEDLLHDALHASFVSGQFAAVASGTELRWVMSEVCCADCADNALELVLKGAEFPTGHVLPPAHGGCRCVLEPA